MANKYQPYVYLSAILLKINLLIVGCQIKPESEKQSIDSLKIIHSTLKHPDTDSVLTEKGQALFMENCNRCHTIFKTDNYLNGVVQRLGDAYLKQFLTTQDSLIKAKDSYALKVKKMFGNRGNSHNFSFSDDELNAIISFLNQKHFQY